MPKCICIKIAKFTHVIKTYTSLYFFNSIFCQGAMPYFCIGLFTKAVNSKGINVSRPHVSARYWDKCDEGDLSKFPSRTPLYECVVVQILKVKQTYTKIHTYKNTFGVYAIGIRWTSSLYEMMTTNKHQKTRTRLMDGRIRMVFDIFFSGRTREM